METHLRRENHLSSFLHGGGEPEKVEETGSAWCSLLRYFHFYSTVRGPPTALAPNPPTFFCFDFLHIDSSNNFVFGTFFSRSLESEGDRLYNKFWPWPSEMRKSGGDHSTTIAIVAVATAFRAEVGTDTRKYCRSNARHRSNIRAPHAPSPRIYVSKVWNSVWPEGQEAIHI